MLGRTTSTDAPPCVLSCSAGYDCGGMGQHFSAIVEYHRSTGRLAHYFSSSIRAGDDQIATIIRNRFSPYLFTYTPLRFNPGAKAHLGGVWFEREVIRHLPSSVSGICSFNGQSLGLFRAAEARKCNWFELVAATGHVAHVRRQHLFAAKLHSIEPDWLNDAQFNRTLKEYERAHRIYVSSELARQTFIVNDVPEGKLVRVHYPVAQRFGPNSRDRRDSYFRIIYCGSVCVTKGVAVLVEAFRRFANPQARLLLFGGCATRRMRVWIDRQRAEDARITLSAGDPLSSMQTADVCVHPSFQDGLAYSAMEALACSVPVVVTEDTGMKEYVREGVNGFVVPTGQWEPIVQRLEFLAKHPLRGTFAPPVIRPGFVDLK